MNSALTIGLCLCLLTFGPRYGHGNGGPALVKTSNCVNTSSEGSTSLQNLCKSYKESDKTGDAFDERLTTDQDMEEEEEGGPLDPKDQFSRSLRVPSHQFMRFGRDHKFLRFGRDVQHKFMRFGRGPGYSDGSDSQMGHKFMRFGRRDDMSGGLSKHQFMRFGKSAPDMGGHKFLRFGKSVLGDSEEERNNVAGQDNSDEEDNGYEIEDLEYAQEPEMGAETVDEDSSRIVKREHKFLRFGRAPGMSGHSFMRFGRNPKTTVHNFMRFGRIPEHNFFRFGRSGSSQASAYPFPKLTSTSTTPVITKSSSLTDENIDLVGKNKANEGNDEPTLSDHNLNYMNENGMKLKRDGQWVLRLGRK